MTNSTTLRDPTRKPPTVDKSYLNPNATNPEQGSPSPAGTGDSYIIGPAKNQTTSKNKLKTNILCLTVTGIAVAIGLYQWLGKPNDGSPIKQPIASPATHIGSRLLKDIFDAATFVTIIGNILLFMNKQTASQQALKAPPENLEISILPPIGEPSNPIAEQPSQKQPILPEAQSFLQALPPSVQKLLQSLSIMPIPKNNTLLADENSLPTTSLSSAPTAPSGPQTPLQRTEIFDEIQPCPLTPRTSLKIAPEVSPQKEMAPEVSKNNISPENTSQKPFNLGITNTLKKAVAAVMNNSYVSSAIFSAASLISIQILLMHVPHLIILGIACPPAAIACIVTGLLVAGIAFTLRYNYDNIMNWATNLK